MRQWKKYYEWVDGKENKVVGKKIQLFKKGDMFLNLKDGWKGLGSTFEDG